MHILIQFKLCQMVTNLEKMMVERLTLFRLRSDNKLPGRILVYRDGVSEVGSTCLSLLKRHVKLLRLTGAIFDCRRRRTACNKGRVSKVQHAQGSLPAKTNHCHLCKYFSYTGVVISKSLQGKRHHTRFYPTDPENADGNGNPKAGTVVDRGVTAVYSFDFFLQGMLFFYTLTTSFSYRSV